MAERKPILELGGPHQFADPQEYHRIVVALSNWGIASPASDLEWLRATLGPLWRWEAVGAVGQLIEPRGRRYGIFLQHLIQLVPTLRLVSLCHGFPRMLSGLVNESAFQATVFELNIAAQVVQRVGPFKVQLNPDLTVKGRLRQADMAVDLGVRAWIECKTVSPGQSTVKQRVERLGNQFRELVRAQGLPAPNPHVSLHLNFGDGKAFERRIPVLVSSLARHVRAGGWAAMMDHDLDPTGKLWPAEGREARPGTVGIRPPFMSPSRVPPSFSESMEWNAWQSRKVADLIKEATDQLPLGEPQIVCIETPNPGVHIARANHWLTTSPRGENVAILLFDLSQNQVTFGSRLANPEWLTAAFGIDVAPPG